MSAIVYRSMSNKTIIQDHHTPREAACALLFTKIQYIAVSKFAHHAPYISPAAASSGRSSMGKPRGF
jgi:hypothetical protein